MKIYNVAVYGLDNKGKLKYVDRILLSKERKEYKEIATKIPITIIKSEKEINNLYFPSLVVTKANINMMNKVDNYMLDIFINKYSKTFFDTRFAWYVQKMMCKSIDIEKINDNLLHVIHKKVKKKDRLG